MDSGPTDMTKQFGLKIAFLTDPVGTRIELTEGLSKQYVSRLPAFLSFCTGVGVVRFDGTCDSIYPG